MDGLVLIFSIDFDPVVVDEGFCTICVDVLFCACGYIGVDDVYPIKFYELGSV